VVFRSPKTYGWKYVGVYGTGRRRRGMGASGTSMQFEDNLKCRYLMFINDGSWHGNDFLRQLDIFLK